MVKVPVYTYGLASGFKTTRGRKITHMLMVIGHFWIYEPQSLSVQRGKIAVNMVWGSATVWNNQVVSEVANTVNH